MSQVAQLLQLRKDWYETERNTADLLKAVVSERSIASLSGDDIWNLLRLTWITRSDDHWEKLKVPALARLWRTPQKLSSGLIETIRAMSLPPKVANLAVKPTGFVNFRNEWRNSSQTWCAQHRKLLVTIIAEASRLERNDQGRIELATKIEALPRVPPPAGAGGHAAASIMVTPLIACLDPHRRFPTINGREAVRDLLKALGLANRDFTKQVTGMVGLIGKLGIKDSFALDVLAEDIIGIAKKLPRRHVSSSQKTNDAKPVRGGSPLPDLDVDERQALQKVQTVVYRNRHNKMTNALKRICEGWRVVKRGTSPDCCYDALIENYDATGRDLLVEAKPDPDKGSVRIAIGQLFDYSRFLPHRAGTDCALLTISKPPKGYRQLLLDLQISPIWFLNEDCDSLEGSGKVWEALKASLASLSLQNL